GPAAPADPDELPPLTGAAPSSPEPEPEPSVADAEDAEPEAPRVEIPPTDLEAAEGLVIQAVEITGLRRVSPEDVATYLKSKAGAALDPDVLRRDVKELWRSGFFDDIEVDLRRLNDRVMLRFHVKERATVRVVEFDGNKEIKDDDL